ncbi:hypothetical protein D3C85_1712020 [compost metagenome]
MAKKSLNIHDFKLHVLSANVSGFEALRLGYTVRKYINTYLFKPVVNFSNRQRQGMNVT